MFELKHHGFFKLYLPKNRDPENIDWTEVFMEESHLLFQGKITKDYKYNQGERTLLDIDLLPSFIYLAWYQNQNNPNGQFQKINHTIDRLFAKKLLSFTPIYRCTEFLDYHFNYFTGQKALFFKYLRHEILPLCENIIEEMKDEKDFSSKIPKFETLSEVVQEWIIQNSKNESKSNLISKLKSFNWAQIVGILLTLISVIIAIIVEREILLEFFDQIINRE
jgi:hypothetical protein